MRDLRDKVVGSEPGSSMGAPTSATGPSPGRVFVVGAVVIIAIVAALLVAIRTFVFPIWEANSKGTRQVATAEAQLSAARTQEAFAPRPTATSLSAPVAQSTSVPTATSTVGVVVSAESNVAPTAAIAVDRTPSAQPSATRVALPTVPPELESDIAAAYQKFFEVTSDALLSLDATTLRQVAAGQALVDIQQTIENDRAQGRALKTNVRHEFVVLGVQGNEAAVADRQKDSSIYVDPATQDPLPGQVAPATPDVAPTVAAIYRLQRLDGVWKVTAIETSR